MLTVVEPDAVHSAQRRPLYDFIHSIGVCMCATGKFDDETTTQTKQKQIFLSDNTIRQVMRLYKGCRDEAQNSHSTYCQFLETLLQTRYWSHFPGTISLLCHPELVVYAKQTNLHQFVCFAHMPPASRIHRLLHAKIELNWTWIKWD